MLIASNVAQTIIHNDAEKQWTMERRSLMWTISDLISDFELQEVDHFTSELDEGYIHIVSIEPIGFINYSLKDVGFRNGFVSVLYNITFNWIEKEDINGSLELWNENNTYSGYMTFDVAIANNREPMSAGNIYKFFFVYNAYQFYNVIYYEKIVTGRLE
jgi:hypothetical protein